MTTAARYQKWHGSPVAPPETHSLQAGPVTALLEGPDLRYLRIGDVEIARRIYVGVRDTAWNTVPGTMSNLQVNANSDGFVVTFEMHHAHEDVRFTWQGRIVGLSDGTVSYEMDGVAESDFSHNKIGLNVHHPLNESVGQPFEAVTDTGTYKGRLPEIIDPQRIEEGGRLSGMFDPFTSLTLHHKSGPVVRFDFEGDQFEMQDHRNWTDANYKTYGTPLSVPWPMSVKANQRLRQKVTVTCAHGFQPVPSDAAPTRVEIGPASPNSLPAIGTAMPDGSGSVSGRESELLRALYLHHVRVDLHLNSPGHSTELERAIEVCRAVTSGLEIALFASPDAQQEFSELGRVLADCGIPVHTILVFEEATGFSTFRVKTPPALVARAKQLMSPLLPGTVFVGGTDQFFTELNRDWSEIDKYDGIAFSLNPQVHASDALSLMENLEGQGETVKTTRHFAPDTPIFITPITFIGRSGPYPAGPPDPNGLPPEVDVRQASLFGAVWTMGSINRLSAAGVTSLTFFETVGWKGLMQRNDEASTSELFPARPGEVFPLYHVFADIGEWRGGKLTPTSSSDPLSVTAMTIQTDREVHILLGNKSATERRVSVGPISGVQVRIRHLDEETVGSAMTDVEGFRSTFVTEPIKNGWIELDLKPYALIRIDAPSG